jgi:hypothetical protein
MNLLVITFLIVFLGVFLLCLAGAQMLQHQKNLKMLEQRRKHQIKADNESSWYRNKYSIMH